MARWRINANNGSFTGLEADFQPACPHCRVTQLEPMAIKLITFPLNEEDWWKRGIKNAHAIDVEVRCPACGYWEPYGVACPEDHWEKINKAAAKLWESAAPVAPKR
jgi:hypothetical protein